DAAEAGTGDRDDLSGAYDGAESGDASGGADCGGGKGASSEGVAQGGKGEGAGSNGRGGACWERLGGCGAEGEGLSAPVFRGAAAADFDCDGDCEPAAAADRR